MARPLAAISGAPGRAQLRPAPAGSPSVGSDSWTAGRQHDHGRQRARPAAQHEQRPASARRRQRRSAATPATISSAARRPRAITVAHSGSWPGASSERPKAASTPSTVAAAISALMVASTSKAMRRTQRRLVPSLPEADPAQDRDRHRHQRGQPRRWPGPAAVDDGRRARRGSTRTSRVKHDERNRHHGDRQLGPAPGAARSLRGQAAQRSPSCREPIGGQGLRTGVGLRVRRSRSACRPPPTRSAPAPPGPRGLDRSPASPRPHPRPPACSPRSRRSRDRARRGVDSRGRPARSRPLQWAAARGQTSWASSRRSTVETWIGRSPSRSRTAAPSPRTAHQRRARAGAETAAASSSPSSLDGQQGGEDRDAAHQVVGAVDRVDDPARPAVAGLVCRTPRPRMP